MSITYPNTPSFKSINLRVNDPTIVSKSQSGKRHVRKLGGHLWAFTLSYPPLSKSQFAPVLAALVNARGRYETFTVIPPNLATPLGTQTADTNVSLAASAGATSVSISGAGSNKTFKAGDVLKFSNHAKVYMLTADSTSTGGGTATLTFNPPLVTAVTTSPATTVKHSNVPFTVYVSNDIQEIKTDVMGFNTYELDVEEAL